MRNRGFKVYFFINNVSVMGISNFLSRFTSGCTRWIYTGLENSHNRWLMLTLRAHLPLWSTFPRYLRSSRIFNWSAVSELAAVISSSPAVIRFAAVKRSLAVADDSSRHTAANIRTAAGLHATPNCILGHRRQLNLADSSFDPWVACRITSWKASKHIRESLIDLRSQTSVSCLKLVKYIGFSSLCVDICRL